MCSGSSHGFLCEYNDMCVRSQSSHARRGQIYDRGPNTDGRSPFICREPRMILKTPGSPHLVYMGPLRNVETFPHTLCVRDVHKVQYFPRTVPVLFVMSLYLGVEC